MIKKAVWISYDLGINGPYEELYLWLDSMGAKECGDSLAFFQFSTKDNIEAEIKKQIRNKVRVRKRDRIYMIYLKDGKMNGSFLFGNRKSAPWKGKAYLGDDTADE